MPQSLASIYIHLIFSTKDRAPLLTDNVREPLHSYIATILKTENSPAILINSVEDHIHLLFKLSRTLTLAKAVEHVKRDSSKWLKSQDLSLAHFSWQAGYGAFSVSESNAGQVANYIAKQQEHHAKTSFQDEMRQFLDKHQITYDEKYLWD